jgi:hypothetical protein
MPKVGTDGTLMVDPSSSELSSLKLTYFCHLKKLFFNGKLGYVSHTI